MGPPRSRQVYVTGEEPRIKNLRDGGEDPRFNGNRRDNFYANQDALLAPPPTITPSDRRNYNLWCDYHREYGHTLEQCREFKRILHQMAEEGKLGRFLGRKEYTSRGGNERSYRPRSKPLKEEERKEVSSDTRGVINMIVGGFSEDYPTIRAVKDSVHTLLKGPPKSASGGPAMKFDATIAQPLQQPHTDPLVVTIKIGRMKVRRVFIDTGSTADLITMDCLKQIKFEEKHLQPFNKPLIGFGGNQVIPLGTITLPVRIGERDKCRTMPICFTVVDLNFSYNAIMGLPLINKIKAVISPH